MYNLQPNISQLLKLKFKILILLSLFGCYPVSHIIIGEVKSPINVADVKVYFDFPKNCEKIAIIEASSNFALKDPSFDFTHQNKTDKALSRLKEEAASMGANGLVVNDLSTKKITSNQIRSDEDGKLHSSYSSYNLKEIKAIAIYVH